MLAKRFEDILHKLGMAGLEHPLFCNLYQKGSNIF